MSAQPVDGRHLAPGPALELHGPAYEWSLWSTTVRVVTAEPGALRSAKRLVDDVLAHVELAASPERADAEVARLRGGRWVHVGATLTALVAAALAVDEQGLTWPGLELDEQARLARVPSGTLLDLTAVARPWAADRCAQIVAGQLDVGCLVSLGGDIATAGPLGSSADSGWEVLVQDVDGGPAAVVAVPTGLALATVDGARGGRWRAVTVVAADCTTARAVAARLVDSPDDPGEAVAVGVPVRAVRHDGTVELAGGWPLDAEMGDTPVLDLVDSLT